MPAAYCTYSILTHLVGEVSPNMKNTSRLNCSDDVYQTVYDYDSQKYTLVDTTIPVISLVLSVLSMVVNVIFVLLTVKGLREKKLPFKGYSLLLNRSITDILTSLLTFIFVALHKVDQIKNNAYPKELRNATFYDIDYLIPHGRTMFTLLLTLNYWAASGAYAVLAIFTYFAVRHPMIYKVRMTNKKTVLVMVGVWLVGLLYSILVVSLSSNNAFNVFNDNDDLIQWSVTSEDYVLSISNLLIVLLALVVVSASYITIIAYLWRMSRQSGNATLHLFSIGRLALNISAFVFACVVMAGFVAIPLFLKGHIDDLIAMSVHSSCETIVSVYQLGYQMAAWTTVAMCGWLLRMSIDPVANLLLDARFKELYRPWLCSNGEEGSARPLVFFSHSSGDFLRKMVEMNVVPSSVLSSDSAHYFRFRSQTVSDAPSAPEPDRNKSKLRRFENIIKLTERVL